MWFSRPSDPPPDETLDADEREEVRSQAEEMARRPRSVYRRRRGRWPPRRGSDSAERTFVYLCLCASLNISS